MLAPGGGGVEGDVLWSLIFISQIHNRPEADVPFPNVSTLPAATTPTLTENDTVTRGVYAHSTSSIFPPLNSISLLRVLPYSSAPTPPFLCAFGPWL